MDYNAYVENNNLDLLESNLVKEHYLAVRKSNLLLFKSLSDEAWLQVGNTGNKQFTTRSIPFIVAGHKDHHLNVIKERYL